MNCTRCMSTTCMTQDCIIFLRDVNKIITLLEELKSKLQSKITNTRINREHIALKYAKGVISSHLESTSEIRDQLIILQGFFKEKSSSRRWFVLRSFYKTHIKEFKTIYAIYRSMLF
jgi:hypothetical protein